MLDYLRVAVLVFLRVSLSIPFYFVVFLLSTLDILFYLYFCCFFLQFLSHTVFNVGVLLITQQIGTVLCKEYNRPLNTQYGIEEKRRNMATNLTYTIQPNDETCTAATSRIDMFLRFTRTSAYYVCFGAILYTQHI